MVPCREHTIYNTPFIKGCVEGFGHIAKVFPGHVYLSIEKLVEGLFDDRYLSFGKDVGEGAASLLVEL